MSEWPILMKPPVVVALFQLKFAQGDIDLLQYQAEIDYSYGDMVRQILNIDNNG